MGFNTSMIILNDALHYIKDDKDFGAKVYEAARNVYSERKPQEVHSGLVNAATVIETHHADTNTIVAFGGNRGLFLGHAGFSNATPEEMLKDLANQMGFRLVRKTK